MSAAASFFLSGRNENNPLENISPAKIQMDIFTFSMQYIFLNIPPASHLKQRLGTDSNVASTFSSKVLTEMLC